MAQSNKSLRSKLSGIANQSYGLEKNNQFRGDLDEQNLEALTQHEGEPRGSVESSQILKKGKGSKQQQQQFGGLQSINNSEYEKDEKDKENKPLAVDIENDEGFSVHENIQTNDDLNSPGRNALQQQENAEESIDDAANHDNLNNSIVKITRTDRFGNEIISRKSARQQNLKSTHKLTFVDQIQSQVMQYAENASQIQVKGNKTIYHWETKQGSKSPPKGIDGHFSGLAQKSQKKIIQLDCDKTRGIVNIFYVESYKRYNAMEIDDESNNNHICKCNIF